MQRIVTGIILIMLLIVIVAIGGWFFALIATGAFVLALWEEYSLLNAIGHKTVRWPAYAAVLLSVPLVLIFSIKFLFPTLLLSCLLTIIYIIFRKDPDFTDIVYSCLPIFSIVLPGLCLISLTTISPYILQLTAIGLVFLISILGDTMAYVFGSLIGGKKLAPNVSAKKTISGSFGGLVGSISGALLAGGLASLLSPEQVFLLPSFWQLLFIGLLGGVAAQLGDLFASLLKRHGNVKDFGNLFPGHGGMMDRLDSILFVSMVVFCFFINYLI